MTGLFTTALDYGPREHANASGIEYMHVGSRNQPSGVQIGAVLALVTVPPCAVAVGTHRKKASIGVTHDREYYPHKGGLRAVKRLY